MSNTIFLIVGESGSGKTTIVKELEKKYELKSISSYTTRPKREFNEYGHIFISADEFNKLENICAYSEIQGNQYGATSEQVDMSDLYVIDVGGIEYFKTNFKGTKRVKVIYIQVPTVDRYLRMIQRGDAIEEALARINIDRKSFSNVKQYTNHITNNKNLTEAVEDIYTYITDVNNEEDI
ncbi:MAG: hypothetical protein RR806_08750 [Oscillospiraceae bacterium]